MSSPPRCSYWWPRSGASSGMPAPSRSETASASARWTSGFIVFRPLGVCTGSASRERRREDRLAARRASPPCSPVGSVVKSFRICDAKRLKRIAPFESRSSCRFQFFSGSHAPLTSTGPDEPSRKPPGALSHIETRLSRHSSPAYWRLPTATCWSSSRLNRLPGRPSRAGEAVLDLDQAEPRAQRPLGLLDPDDAVEARERLLGVRQPVAVVAVRDVVGPDERRHLVRRERAGHDRLVARAPVALGARAVEDRQAEDREARAARRCSRPPARRARTGSRPASSSRRCPCCRRRSS